MSFSKRFLILVATFGLTLGSSVFARGGGDLPLIYGADGLAIHRTESGIKFNSNVMPPYVRKSLHVSAVLPWLCTPKESPRGTYRMP